MAWQRNEKERREKKGIHDDSVRRRHTERKAENLYLPLITFYVRVNFSHLYNVTFFLAEYHSSMCLQYFLLQEAWQFAYDLLYFHFEH